VFLFFTTVIRCATDVENSKLVVCLICEPGSSVSIVSGCRLDYQTIKVRSPVEVKGFFL
jgi:hypothetical protein